MLTQKEMARSDVVFFLSRCSQFLDMTDMELLRHQLPSKGVKRLVLVGGQFDSAILDDGYDRDSLAITEKHLHKRLTERAHKEMTALATAYQEHNPDLANLLNKLAQPILASTYAYVFANFPIEQWQQNPNMKHIHESFQHLAEQEWQGASILQHDWERIANFEPLLMAYQQARDDKSAIIEQQLNALLPDAERNLNDFLLRLNDSVENKIATLQKNDISNLAAAEKDSLKQIEKISAKLEGVIGGASDTANTERLKISRQLQNSMFEFKNLQTKVGTEVEKYPSQESDSTWYKPWTWGSSKTVYRTRINNYNYISSSDAAAQVNQYAQDCAFSIEKAFQNLLNSRQLKADLRQVLANSLQTNSIDFDPQTFKNLLDNELRQLILPDFHLSIDDATRKISSHFQGEIRGNDMDRLRGVLNTALSDVFFELNSKFIKETDSYINDLKNIQNNLAYQLTERIKADLAQTRAELEYREVSVRSYQDLANLIKQL